MAKKRANGYYQKQFTYEGKRYTVYAEKKSELDAKKAQKLAELQQGSVNRVNPTLNDYYKDTFTPNRENKIKEATLRCQEFQFNNCANVVIDQNGKTLGELRMNEIKPKDVQAVQRELEKSGRSSTTVNNCMSHLKHVFNAAVKDETITKSPCLCIENVKRFEPKAADTIHRALSLEETQRFFEMAKARRSYYLPVFQFMIKTGMRVGEVAGLLDIDIDEKNSVIHIRRTITKNIIGGYELGGSAKTESGLRDIPLTSDLMKIIKEQRLMNRMLYGDGKCKPTIFKSPEGEYLRDYATDREITRICQAAGIDRFSSHAFRATYATRFIEQRPQDYKALSKILGHSNTKITLDLYTHVMEDRKDDAFKSVQISV